MSDQGAARHDAPGDNPEPVSASGADGAAADGVVTATLRRSPKYTVFLLLGAAVGVLVALILTFTFAGTARISEEGYQYSQGQVFGFLMLVCVPVGLAVFGGLALVLDRVVGRRTRELRVAHERVRDEE